MIRVVQVAFASGLWDFCGISTATSIEGASRRKEKAPVTRGFSEWGVLGLNQ